MKTSLLWTGILLAAAARSEGQELEKPIRLEADGKPIDTEIGHAAPFLCDFYHRGKPDLLVGEFTGKLRIYKNLGSAAAPRFGEMAWFQADGEVVQIPTS